MPIRAAERKQLQSKLMPPTPEAVREAVKALVPPDADGASYLEYHHRRYEYLINALVSALSHLEPAAKGQLRLLDIGMSHQTSLLHQLFPDASLTTLGYFDHRFSHLAGVEHTEFDLNTASSVWPRIGPFDAVVMAEVIEHLYIPPTRILPMVRSLMRPGGVLILQTPNPVSLWRRLSLLVGRSPFEIIRDDTSNPGHYCEYTLEQLEYLAGVTGFEVRGAQLRNYFGSSKWTYNVACALLPGHLADGITILLRRPPEEVG